MAEGHLVPAQHAARPAGALSPSLLQAGVAHLFLGRPEGLLAAVPRHDTWLSQQERARAQRYRHPGDGAGYRATRVLVRGVLAGLTGRPPSELIFLEVAHGRPVLRPGTARLDFNASRSRGLLALVVTSGAACGVDVEDVSREADFLGVARAFAPEERAFLEAAEEEEQRRRFFALWTLKEATLKALGTGLTLSLSACAFQLLPGEPPRVRFGPAVQQVASDWAFTLLAPDSGHLVAVAVRHPRPVDFVVHGDAETCAAAAEAA